LGWWDDIFELEISLDSEHFTNRGGLLGSAKCPLYDTKSTITGKVIVTPPPNTAVWQYGVDVELQGSVSQFTDFETSEYLKVKTKVSDEGYISAKTEFAFEIDLTKVKNFLILETYDGELFHYSYELIVTIVRPWYTFNVQKAAMLAIQNVHEAPRGDKLDDVAQSLIEKGSEAPISHVIKINDYSGTCFLTYDHLCYNIGDVLIGNLTFKEDPQIHIAEVKLVLYKIEKADVEESEYNVKEQIIDISKATVVKEPEKGEEPTETVQEQVPNDAGEEQKAAERVADEPEVKTAKVSPDEVELKPPIGPVAEKLVTFEFKMEPVSHTLGVTLHEDLKEADVFLSVRYYLRLVIKDIQGNTYWNTNEVILYRKALKGTSQVV